MEIQKVIKRGSEYIVNDQFSIPHDEENDYFKQIIEWEKNGGVIEEFQADLTNLKNLKIAQIKQIRDQKNIDPITDHQAPIVDSEGNLGEEVYFIFHTTRYPSNPAADPNCILSNAVIVGETNYFTKNLNGEKICVQIDSEIARSLLSHLKIRNENNFKLAEAIIAAINEAGTAEEVEAICWNSEFLS